MSLIETIKSKNIKCFPLSVEHGKEKQPANGCFWKTDSTLHDNLPKMARIPGRFAITTASFKDDMLVIDVDINKNITYSELTESDKSVYDELVSVFSHTFIEKSSSNNGSLHIYTYARLGKIKKSKKISDNLSIDFFSKDSSAASYIIPSFNHLASSCIDIKKITDTALGYLKTLVVSVVKKQNITRTYDENLYIEKEVVDAISYIPNNNNLGYDEYLQIGMALHDATKGGRLGLKLWNNWSIKSKKHDENTNNVKWSSFSLPHCRENAITANTLFAIARKNGYLNNIEKKIIGLKSLTQEKGIKLEKDYCDSRPSEKEVYFNIVKKSNKFSPFSNSVGFYLLASSICGVAGRVFNIKHPDHEEPTNLNMMTMLGAPAGAGKDTLLNIFKNPIKREIEKLEIAYDQDCLEYIYLKKQYESDFKEWVGTDSDEKPIPPRPPIDPRILQGNATANGVRKHIGKINGQIFLAVPEFKTMLGNVRSDANDWSGLFCALWSGDMPQKLTGAEDRYTTSPYPGLSAIFMDQCDTMRELIASPVIRDAGVLARSFFEITEKVSNGSKKGISLTDPDYKTYCNFVSYALNLSNAMCKENRPPIKLRVSDECAEILKKFKNEMLLEYNNPASSVGQPTMLLRSAENALRLFGAFWVYKKWYESTDNYLTIIENNIVDDIALLTFCIELTRNNIKTVERALKESDDKKDDPYSTGVAKLIKAIRMSAINNFDYKRVSELRSIRTIFREMALSDIKVNKRETITAALLLMVDQGLLTKKGNTYEKIN